ncbi:MAG: hypothetical protein HY678_06315, partial [Chloroflexi bacterium]|nr:hypothetical protein [Chloroflexota bacterium]
VSADGKTIATISTSGSVTATGKYAVGKMMKTRSDMYFPLLADAERRIVVLTEKDRFDQCANSHMQRPFDLEARLLAARKKASTEMTPPTEPGIGRG